MRFTDANVARLRARTTEYIVWDSRVPGLGIRIRPTGYRAYIYQESGGSSLRRRTLGPATLVSIDEARRKCLNIQLETEPNTVAPSADGECVPRLCDFVAGEWKSACYARYKAWTRNGVNQALRRQLLPAFGVLALDKINAVDVSRWFDRYSATSPGGANYTLSVLRQIFNHAIAVGHVRNNPTRGIKQNPRRKLTRFLSQEEIRRLHQVLDQCVVERPSRRANADIIRLLLLTGCRKNEIDGLRWREIKEDGLELLDSKTGPRRVFLNAEARAILDQQPRTGSPYVFPSPLDSSRPRSRRSIPFWNLVRKKAGIEDVRLHDLRYTFASHAVMQGIPLPTVARLLGHRHVSMTCVTLMSMTLKWKRRLSGLGRQSRVSVSRNRCNSTSSIFETPSRANLRAMLNWFSLRSVIAATVS